MDLNFLFKDRPAAMRKTREERKTSSMWRWFNFWQRKPNSDEEINEIHHLISNVYESMDDQARAVVLSLSKLVQEDDESISIEEKIRAVIDIGHSVCCAHTQVKNATQLYSKLLVRTLNHKNFRMRLASIIAIAEVAIDNLPFQIKLNEMGIFTKLIDLMKISMPQAGRTLTTMNEHSKLIAWYCYAIMNLSVNCLPNMLYLRKLVSTHLTLFEDASQLEIWRYAWRENFAQTIIEFFDGAKLKTTQPSMSVVLDDSLLVVESPLHVRRRSSFALFNSIIDSKNWCVVL